MKKNLIALAVAGALVAPVAMAEVTITGGLQAEVVSIGGDKTSANGLYATDGWQVGGGEGAGNYGFLKFAANEDLGGGMKALAVYNMNISVGDGHGAPVGTTKAASDRDAYVGLVTGMGTILAGTVTLPYAQNRTIDPFVATSFQARGNYGMTTLHNSYLGNTIAYANSFMGGMVKLVAGVSLDENKKGTDDSTVGKHAKSFAIDVAPMTGLGVTVAYVDASSMSACTTTSASTVTITDGTDADTAADVGTYTVTTTSTSTCAEGGKDANATKLAATYAAGAFSVAAQMEMLNKGMTASGEKGNVVYLTGTFKLDGANSISASFGAVDKKVHSATEKDGANYMAVGFKHAFSKNTSAMVGYRVSDDKAASKKETAIGAGLRVAF